MKVCYDLSRDVREGLAEYSIPPSIRSELLDHQATAVQALGRRIITRGGTMLGDVVGLGKTLTAIAVALMLREEHGYLPLIVCPKNLVTMWTKHLDAYDLPGRVVSYSRAHTELPEMRRYPFVIVDESHILRNDTRRDYRAVQDYIHANESKVLLLTATPYNIRFRDVANQLALYIDDDDDLAITPSAALAADPQLYDKVDGKVTTLAAFRRSEEPDDWKRLMSEHLIRRTRSFIKANYARTDNNGEQYLQFTDGQRFQFPSRRAKPINHSFGDSDPAAVMASTRTLTVLQNLALPRYQLGAYLRPNATSTPEEERFVTNLGRGRGNVAGFVRTTFYKRLSSCGYSFTLSVQRHIARNELFLYAIDHDLALPTGTIAETSLSDDDDATQSDLDPSEHLDDDPERRYNTLLNASPAGLTWVRPDLFTSQLRTALEADTASLRELLASYGGWDASRDSKLNALTDLARTTHAHEKVLIFTEYKDTANYIGAALRIAGVTDLAVATGETEDPTSLARRFSPHSNTLPGQADPGPEHELRVLIATDVLSEGQNLQDAHIVVNYDLPWAIVRLIQRAGRIDRIGQAADTVLVYSFFHESLDNVITLRQRISNRLHANAEAFGSDEQFFGSDDEIRAITDLYNGTVDDLDQIDDVDASSLAFERWNTLQKTDPAFAARIAAMPDLVSATRARRLTDSSATVICHVRTEAGVDGFGAVGPDAAITRLLSGHEALRAFEAGPDEPGLDHQETHDDLLTNLVRGPLSTPTRIAGRLRGVRRNLWHRLGEELHNHDTDTSAALDALFQHPLTADADRRLRRAIRNGASNQELAARVSALHRDDQLVIAARSDRDPIRIVSSMGITP